MMSRTDRALAFLGASLGFGLVPVAPGTAGALPGVGIYLLIAWLAPPGNHVWWIGGSLLVVSGLTVAMAPWAERYWKQEDSGNYTLDEIAGFLMTVLLFRTESVLLTVVWVFSVTRAFDIAKPPPCRQLERLPDGWGVLADDLFASLYAAGFLHVLAWVAPHLVGRGFGA